MEWQYTGETRALHGDTLHLRRIMWRRNDKEAWVLGGWIAGDSNIAGNGVVVGNGIACGAAVVAGQATVGGNAVVRDGARVKDDAYVGDNARVGGNAVVAQAADVTGDAHVFGNAVVFGAVRGYAYVSDNATIAPGGVVFGTAEVAGDVRVGADMHIGFGTFDHFAGYTDPDYIACSLGIWPVSGRYHLYKFVRATDQRGVWASIHDDGFLYRVGAWVEAEVPDLDPQEACAAGLHVAMPWGLSMRGDAIIAVEVKQEDIITCLAGKLRVRKLYVEGVVKDYGKLSESLLHYM